MKQKVSKISVLEYITGFASFRTPLSDFYVKTRKCIIFGIFDVDHVGKGLLLAEQSRAVEKFYALEERRGYRMMSLSV